jgi:thiosulfate/3-mercaptopyruvate sulfurtransferase
LWNGDDVLAGLQDPAVKFYDTRSLEEFTGESKRGNARGGHLPGAVHINYEDLLDTDKCALDAGAIQRVHEDAGLSKDQTIVPYCQTSTRVSLPYLALRDLGYNNIAVYETSMHEWPTAMIRR